MHAEWSGEETEPAILEGKLAILLKLIISKVHMPFAPALQHFHYWKNLFGYCPYPSR